MLTSLFLVNFLKEKLKSAIFATSLRDRRLFNSLVPHKDRLNGKRY